MEEDNNIYLKYYDLLSQATSASDLISPNVTYIAGDTEEVVYGWYNDGDPLEIIVDPISGKPVIQKKGPEYVDLGLSVLWAKTNLGAENEQDYGKYYAWGDTTGYAASEVSGKFTQEWYNTLPAASISTDLSGQNDAVTVALGSNYRMPSKAEYQELINNTNPATGTTEGIAGMFFTSKTDSTKKIFIPFAGSAFGGSVSDQGDDALVWSSSFKSSSDTWYLGCSSYGNFGVNGSYRFIGLSVRPVKIKS